MSDTVVVDVKPWWASKTIWTQVVGFLAVLGAAFGFDIDEETKTQIIAGIAGVVGLVTVILKGSAKPSVTPTQAKKAQ